MSKDKDRPETANPYKDTLFLPKTDFPMRGGLPQQEPVRLARWEDEKLYEQLRAQMRRAARPSCCTTARPMPTATSTSARR